MELSMRRSVIVLATCAVIAFGGCQDEAQSGTDTGSGDGAGVPAELLPRAVQELTIDGREYAFAFTPDPASGLRPGWTHVRFNNIGGEAHQVMFARLKDGVDLATVAAAGAGDSSGSNAIRYVDMIGGVSYIGAGNGIDAMVNLPSGVVMAMCYVPDAHGVAHALSGMSTMLTVAPAASSTTTVAPEAPNSDVNRDALVGTIEMAHDGYRFPDQLRPGWYRVKNTDTGDADRGLHELALLRLSRPLQQGEFTTVLDQLARNATPAVGLNAMGGLGAVSAGFEGYVYLDLQPGAYLVVDFMPDPGSPTPHLLNGYAKELSV